MIEVSLLHHVESSPGACIGPRSTYTATPTQLDDYLETRSDWKGVSSEEDLRDTDGKDRYLLTFDDGYRNNLTEALPVLEEHSASCLLFITTGFIEGEVYPYELEMAEAIETVDELRIPEEENVISFEQSQEREAVYEQLRLPLKSAGHEKRQRFMKQLARRNGYRRESMQSVQFLDWEEIQTLTEHPLVTIGAHTHTHPLLSRQPWRVAYEEMKQSKNQLEEHTDQSIDHFSYPYGGNTFFLRQMARWLGFQYAFTTEAERLRKVGWLNRLSIPRIDMAEFAGDNG